MRNLFFSLLALFLLTSCVEHKTDSWQMRGLVLDVNDLASVDWPALAYENGINTIGTHMYPGQVMEFISSEKGKAFLEACRKYGIDVEHQIHAMSELLPRNLFDSDPEMFRMDEHGNRNNDCNCCVHSEKALGIIARNAADFAAKLPSDNHRYYFWLDDGRATCKCDKCRDFSSSEQALLIENRMIEEIRKVDPQARLAHLAYANTLSAPVKVKPAEGIFLEFAPFYRTWDRPLSEKDAQSVNINLEMTHGENLQYLEDNLKVFSADEALVLEYWLDVSLFSRWKKPAVQLPWNGDVFRADVATYASYGIRNVSSFAVYMDSTYFRKYPQTHFLREYGEYLSDF